MNSNINNIRNLNESAIRYKVLTLILRIVQIELVLLCLGGCGGAQYDVRDKSF